MSDVATVLEAVKGLKENQERLSTRLDDIAKQAEETRKQGPWGAPSIRKGENPLTSRGFSYLKALGALAGFVGRDEAKVEFEVAERLRKYYDGWGFKKALPNSIMIPFAAENLCGDDKLAGEVRQIVRAGVNTYDPHQFLTEIRRIPGAYEKALSWLDDATGGALVAPPMFGELIELFRNNEVFMQAGARSLPMPPNGRLQLPRQTSAATAYWVGESNTITDSTPGTGDVTLSAKKLGVLSKIPNELFRFASVSIEMFVREDMARVMALKLDRSLLDATGSAIEPKGLINYSNINSHTSVDSGTTTNGYVLSPNDISLMVSKVEQVNATFKAFVMRPMMWATITNMRALVYNGSSAVNEGPFMFSYFRELGTDMDLARLKMGTLNGYPVYKSTQISNTREKSGGTDLTYILGGDFTDYYVALSGGMEFQVSTQGDSPFTKDETWFRGILYADGAPRHEASFVWCDDLCEDGVRN